jgi:hypothetical protein
MPLSSETKWISENAVTLYRLIVKEGCYSYLLKTYKTALSHNPENNNLNNHNFVNLRIFKIAGYRGGFY